MQQARRRSDRMLVIIAVAVVVFGLLFYMVWQGQMRERANLRTNENPVIQTTRALQTSVSAP